MNHIYVIDTVAIISYFDDFFQGGQRMSPEAIRIIEKGLDKNDNTFKLSIPSIVFVEIYEKFLNTNELKRKFYYEIFYPLSENPDIQIQPIEREVIEVFSSLSRFSISLENHDKIIVSSAIQLGCPLITCDANIKEFCLKSNGLLNSIE